MYDMAALASGREDVGYGERLASLEQHNQDHPPSSGPDPAVKWLFGIIGSLIATGCVLWLTSVNSSINDLSKASIIHAQDIAQVKVQLPHFDKQLDRIELKLDRLLDHKLLQKENIHE